MVLGMTLAVVAALFAEVVNVNKKIGLGKKAGIEKHLRMLSIKLQLKGKILINSFLREREKL